MPQPATDSKERVDVLITIAGIMNSNWGGRPISTPNALFNYIEIAPAMAKYMNTRFTCPINDNLSDWELLVEAINDPDNSTYRTQLAHLAKTSSYRLRYRHHKTEAKDFIFNLLHKIDWKIETSKSREFLIDLFTTIWMKSSCEGQYRLYDIKNEKQGPNLNPKDWRDLIRQSAVIFALDVLATNNRYQSIADEDKLMRFVEIYEFFRAWAAKHILAKRLSGGEVEKWVSSLKIYEVKQIYSQHLFSAGKNRSPSFLLNYSTTKQMIKKLNDEADKLNFHSSEALAYHALKHLNDILPIHPDSTTSLDRTMAKYLETAREVILKGQGKMRPAQWEKAWICEFLHDFAIDYQGVVQKITMKTLVKCVNNQTPVILTCFSGDST